MLAQYDSSSALAYPYPILYVLQIKVEVKAEVKAESPHPTIQRIPQLDGPSTTSSQEDESGSSDGSPSPPSKSVPLPSIKKAPTAMPHTSSLQDDDDAIIGSDLDDSDDDDNGDQDDDEVEGGSKVLCTYDRVSHCRSRTTRS